MTKIGPKKKKCEKAKWLSKEVLQLCHGIKRRLLLGRKVMTNLDSIFKSQSILKETSPEYSLEGLMLKQTPILWPPDTKN